VAPLGWTLWAGKDLEWENDVDAGGFPYLTVVVGTSLASLMLVTFGRRSSMFHRLPIKSLPYPQDLTPVLSALKAMKVDLTQ